MANRWKGNIIAASATTSSGTDYTGKANGSWSLNNQIQQKQAGLWARAVGVPAAPTIGTATPGDAQATIAFTAPSDNGGYTITSYTALSSPSGITGTGASSPITVTGLTNGTAYTFTVAAINSAGTGAYSSASNSVTPVDGKAVLSTGGGYINAYLWSNGFSTLTQQNISSAGQAISISQDNSLVAVASSSSPYVEVYPFSASGFGAKYANPSTLPQGKSTGVAFNRATNVIAVAISGASPYIAAYAWDKTTGFGVRYANPSTLPAGAAQGITIHPTTGDIAISLSAAPWVTAYPWSSGFGTKYANPATVPASYDWGLAFSPTGGHLAVNAATSPFIYVYPWSNGFGTKVTNPTVLIDQASYDAKFTPNESAIAIGYESASPYIAAYAWSSSGFGAKYANPSTALGSMSWSLCFDSLGGVVATGNDTAPLVNAYVWSNGFGTKYANPSTAPSGGSQYGISFTN